MDATDISSDMYEDLREPPQPDRDTAGSSAPKTHPRPKPNNAKKAKEFSDQYNELCWISTEPPQPMRRHLSDGQPGVSAIVEICDPLEFFELIVADEIVDHIAANLFKFICKPIYW